MAKLVLVTGAAKGIGKAICLELAKNGYDVIINYLTSFTEAQDLREQILNLGVKCLAIKADVSNETEVNNMFLEIESKIGTVDVVINNAGVDLSNLFSEKRIEDFKRTLEVNLLGAYIVSKRAFPKMLEKKWGRIINISSTNAINTYYPMCLEYDASKAGLNSLTHNLAMQFAPFVNVNAIAPGFIATENELDGYDEEFYKEETEKIFKKRAGTPMEVAHLVKYLISDEADYINNSIIRIDGGQYGS